MSAFAELRVGRRRLQDFCLSHRTSVESFRDDGSFRVHSSEGSLGPDLRHITSTATCLESLADCPDAPPTPARPAADAIPEEVDPLSGLRRFAKMALDRTDWTSDGSGGTYCRCRALPLVIQYIGRWESRIEGHLERILKQLERPERFAVGEADEEDQEKWYPPNAFHTFWALEALRRSELHHRDSFRAFAEKHDLDLRRAAMLLWSRQLLGRQIALHLAKSSTLDTDQLAWSLATVTRFGQSDSSALSLSEQDMLRQAVECFFQTQEEVGTWRHYEPLFHFQHAGNAYCYVFETLAVLLRNSLQRNSTFLRGLLKPHLPHFLKLLDFAESTQIRLREDPRTVGWSSGHRKTVSDAESWATASVFTCMQALRRLVGVWTREEALQGLNTAPLQLSREDGLKTILERGNTWSAAETVAENLLTMFVNPIRMRDEGETVEMVDPDTKPIADRQMRAAILFGPPGTSKTSLARAVAAAAGWAYVELHASHFVADGLSHVQRTADDIFNKLMELDHTVVLFDEIDELVRAREQEPDIFGRFLTTSMLPRLAELWRQRRIVYFVATNHVDFFDPAVVRAQRFDAQIFVPSPSFDAKFGRLLVVLKEVLPNLEIDVTASREDIEKDLKGIEARSDLQGEGESDLGEEHLLAKFVLLRWDHLEELAHWLAESAGDEGALVVSPDLLRRALVRMSDSRLQKHKAYRNFLANRGRSTRDFGKDLVWRVEKDVWEEARPRCIRETAGLLWCVGSRESILRDASPGYHVEFTADAVTKWERRTV